MPFWQSKHFLMYSGMLAFFYINLGYKQFEVLISESDYVRTFNQI